MFMAGYQHPIKALLTSMYAEIRFFWVGKLSIKIKKKPVHKLIVISKFAKR